MKHRSLLTATILLALVSVLSALPGASAVTGVAAQAGSGSAQPLLVVHSEAAVDWINRAPEGSPSPRSGAAMAYDSARGVTVLFGGSDDKRKYNDTWEWDGTDWNQRSPRNSPAALVHHAMAYDTRRGVTVLFGGYAASAVHGTWEWDGTVWTLGSPAHRPDARYRHAMAYDSERGVVVLFGGYSGGARPTSFNDTWEWDGMDWTQRFPGSAPSERYHEAMVYDSARGVTVLFGGNSGSGRFGDTWEWDGTEWIARSPANSPPAQDRHAMAYDSARGVTVFFGTDGLGNNTWEWDGMDWLRRAPASSPTARNQHAVAYDSARGVTVLFGGYQSWLVGTTQHRVWYGQTWEYVAASEPERFLAFLPQVLR